MRILSRAFALIFAVVVVGGAGWALSRPYYGSVFGPWSREIYCVCLIYPFDETAGWPTLDAGAFSVRAPTETALRKDTELAGILIDRRFALPYILSDHVDFEAIAKHGRDYVEEPVAVDGRDGVLRWSEFAGRAEPYFLQLYVPHAVQARNGRWYTLEIHGWFTTSERRALASKMLRTVAFAPLLEQVVAPAHPKAAPPTFDIAPPEP